MTAVTLSKSWPVRATRIFLILAFVYNLAYGIFDLARGHVYGLICLACVPAIAVTLVWQVWYLRRVQGRSRLRPDYRAIASMERDIWGETFEYEGAPRARGINPEVAELHAMMDDLEERATARRTCIRCGYPRTIASGRCGACYRQWKEARDGEHRSNLRWTTPEEH